MELLFQQGRTAERQKRLESVGIEQCYLKRLSGGRDIYAISKKGHYHTGYEIHMIEDGYQIYELEGQTVRLDKGSYLIVSPGVRHRMTEIGENTCKYGFIFGLTEQEGMERRLHIDRPYAVGVTPSEVWDGIGMIGRQSGQAGWVADTLIEGRIQECILLLFRPFVSAASFPETVERADARFLMAAQYIRDNICQAPSVRDIAAYCYLSVKQLTRIFLNETGMAVAAYVRRERCRYAERLLAEPQLSLRQISDRMNFSSEYYFNTFFKVHAGMSPGEYRRTIQK